MLMRWILILVLAATGCNQLLGGNDLKRSDAGVPGGGDGSMIDAAVPPGCTPAGSQCSNCVDDDGDGAIDSFDVECTAPYDNAESSFATAYPGDNVDPVNQDCFFDGNSGGGTSDDGCSIHVCCLLGATSQAECPISQSSYNPASCPPPIGATPLSQLCISSCGKLAPPGCDCFGCCTICDPVTNLCHDIAVHPATSPNCTAATAFDPAICKRCTKVASCGRPTCDIGTSCILCPGQTPSDLPAACGGVPKCQAGTASCVNGTSCPAGTYCHAGSQCCIGIAVGMP